MGVMGTALTYYHRSLLARETLTCGTQHVHLSHHDSLLQHDFFFFSAQREETDPGMFNVGCIFTAVPGDSLSRRESIGYINFSAAKKIAVRKTVAR